MARDNIRNFCIIAHIDHGKSTLSDRILELTDSVDKRTMEDQILDDMELERDAALPSKPAPLPCTTTPMTARNTSSPDRHAGPR